MTFQFLRPTFDAIRHALASRVTLALFAFLVLSSLIPAVVDIYASPVYRLLFLPSYLVTMVVYDGGLGLEAVVYPIADVLPVDGHLLWEAGQIVAFYLFAVAIGALVGRLGGRGRPPRNSTTSSS